MNSNNNKFVVIYNNNKGTLWSINLIHNNLTHKADFLENTSVYFLADDKYIICNAHKRQIFWSIAEDEFTNDTMCVLGNGNNTNLKQKIEVFCLITDNLLYRNQLIVEDQVPIIIILHPLLINNAQTIYYANNVIIMQCLVYCTIEYSVKHSHLNNFVIFNIHNNSILLTLWLIGKAKGDYVGEA